MCGDPSGSGIPTSRMLKRLRWVRGIKDSPKYQTVHSMTNYVPMTELPESLPTTPRPSDEQPKRSWERDCHIFRHKLHRLMAWLQEQPKHVRRCSEEQAVQKLTKLNPYI